MFDNRDFDSGTGAAAAPVQEKPVYTQTEMNDAVSQAQQRGVDDGYAQAHASVEQKLASLSEKIVTGLADAKTREDERVLAAQHLAVDVAAALVRKIMPELARTQSLEAIEQLVRQCMVDRFEEPRLIIRVHDSMVDALLPRLEPLAKAAGFNGAHAVFADAALGASDCRIEWSNGGAERNVARIWSDLDHEVSRLSAGLNGTSLADVANVITFDAESLLHATGAEPLGEDNVN